MSEEQLFHTNYEYKDRETKAEYVWLKYGSILEGKILDAGADECYLKRYLGDSASYWGVGLGDGIDQQVDLEKERIPFPDNSFDSVLCLDVLEHLDNIHEAFDELCRVARRYVLVSLPNPWGSFWRRLRGGYYRPEQAVKFYGLPPEAPSDRHKWFFSCEEAERFIRYRAARNGMNVLQLDVSEIRSSALKRLAVKILLRRNVDLRNIYATRVWAVLEKACD
jgi:hypothetical protein